ncbi:hypothetical protein B0H14DRAFT_3609873 [Mycena olivaceomarginata]|nr:hypothetical protein B0H14DRAFT_3609873 [Mycena olivaceomarginata]
MKNCNRNIGNPTLQLTNMSDIDRNEHQGAGQEEQNFGPDKRTEQEKETDRKLAERLSHIIEDANAKCIPLCNMIRKHIERTDAQKEEDRDEAELVKAAETILNETNGAIRGADPDNRLTNEAKRNMQDHKATRGGTTPRGSVESCKRDLGPLLDALGRATLTQIVGGVGLLLAGVLNLVGRLLSGLGLNSLLKGIVAATASIKSTKVSDLTNG